MSKKSEFQIISGNQDQVQTHLDQLAGQNWRPILMTATSTSAGITLFVILEGKRQLMNTISSTTSVLPVNFWSLNVSIDQVLHGPCLGRTEV